MVRARQRPDGTTAPAPARTCEARRTARTGEESNYVRADLILKTLKEESEGIYRNILGPTARKGLGVPGCRSLPLWRDGTRRLLAAVKR